MKTKIKARYLPYGALPYDDIKLLTHMMAKLFPQFPYLPILPNLSGKDTLVYRTLCNMPGVILKQNEITIKAGTDEYDKDMSYLDKCFNSPKSCDFERYTFSSPFLEKYLHIIKKFKSHNACINFLGPFTISQLLMNVAKEQMLVDKSFKKLFVQAVCVKALWIIKKIKEYCHTTVPVVILEEPMLGQLSTIKREDENITNEFVTNIIAEVAEKLHKAGALVGVQCMEKCDWTIPINAGVDIISFDAYNNPNNINIISEQIKDFLHKGGKINWGIVPSSSEKIIKGLSLEYTTDRFEKTIEGLSELKVPINLIYKSALVSVNNNTENLPILFAEKALIITTQLASKLAIRS